MPLSPDLQSAVDAFAAYPRLLVATDFDGALAPLVLDPRDSRPVEGGMASLTGLAALPGVTVALVSGRDVDTLRELSGAAEPLVLLGSHGSQDSRRPGGLALDDDQRATLASLDEALARVLEEHPGSRVETKPSARVLHTRGLPEGAERAALDAALAVGERHDVTLTPGKSVVEMAVAHVGKGKALLALADELGVDAVFYSGDDLTDEQGFAALAEDDTPERAARRLTVRVGDGDTAARFTVADEPALVEVLSALLERRRSTPAG